MKYEFTYGQEEANICTEVDSKTSPVFRECLEAFSLLPREKNTWNTAVFVGLGSIVSFSVCSEFTIASKSLYSDELHHLANKLSRFSATVNWPDWDTVDRHYFIQVLDGIIRCALPNCFGLTLLNPKEFYVGRSSPVIELNVGGLRFWRKRRCREYC